MLMLKRLLFYSLLALSIASGVFQTSCRKKDIYNTSPSAMLSFSTNIVKFDTVFTSVGSATHNFTAKNPGKQAVNISDIRLQGGSSSRFTINIDGRDNYDFPNHELAAGDSIYIFAKVHIDPNDVNTPFIVTDTILFILNGHTQKVALQAFGRNAHFIKNRVLGCDTVFRNDGKPIVLYDTAYVPKGCSLTVEQGVTVYCHANAILLIGGSLTCEGTKAMPVIFREDRLEHSYDNTAGQWYGIWILTTSDTNSMAHTIIQDGINGLRVDSLSRIPGTVKMTMNKCIIRNCSQEGLVGFGASITATNSLLYGNELDNLRVDLGGNYNFSNCTFDESNDPVANRQSSIQLGNTLYKNADSIAFLQDLNIAFRNCIIWGDIDDEVQFNKHSNGNAFNAIFYHDIIKAKKINFNNTNTLNQYPIFKDEGGGDYHIETQSPAIDKGVTYPPIPVIDDLDDNIRKTPTDTIPDLGSYEFKP